MKNMKPTEIDPYLKPYEAALEDRARHVEAVERRLTRGEESLTDFASGHEYFGLHLRDGEWVFREWAPNAERMFLIGDFNARRNSRPLRIFHDKGFRRTPGRGATFHFDAGLHLFGAIDHLLHGPKTVPLTRAVAERGRIGSTWPSDHYPVWADYRFAP